MSPYGPLEAGSAGEPSGTTQPLSSPVGAPSGQRRYADPAGRPRRRRHRRLLAVVRRTAVGVIALVAAGAVALAVLLLVTPSASNARQLASAFDHKVGAPYPGVGAPYRFATALEATEDHRFTIEPGVDPIAIMRVIYGHLTGQGGQGGATLYQQLAKMLYTPGRTDVAAEFEQVALAVKLKYTYSGAEILRLYSDVVYFGHNYYGLLEASCGYFGVRPAQMSWPQAAMLAGLVQAPSADDPLTYPANGRAREEHVLGRLVAVGALSQASANRYLRIPLSTLLAHAGACKG